MILRNEYMLKVNNTNTTKRREICSKLNFVLNTNNRLSDAHLMKNIVKKTACKWACITIFKQL